MNNNLSMVFRILLGLIILIFGLSHFYYSFEMAFFMPLPIGAKLFVYTVGVITSLCGIFIVLNRNVRISLIVVAVLLIVTGGMVQLAVEWKNPDEILGPLGMTNVIKLLMASLILMVLTIRKK